MSDETGVVAGIGHAPDCLMFAPFEDGKVIPVGQCSCDFALRVWRHGITRGLLYGLLIGLAGIIAEFLLLILVIR